MWLSLRTTYECFFFFLNFCSVSLSLSLPLTPLAQTLRRASTLQRVLPRSVSRYTEDEHNDFVQEVNVIPARYYYIQTGQSIDIRVEQDHGTVLLGLVMVGCTHVRFDTAAFAFDVLCRFAPPEFPSVMCVVQHCKCSFGNLEMHCFAGTLHS